MDKWTLRYVDTHNQLLQGLTVLACTLHMFCRHDYAEQQKTLLLQPQIRAMPPVCEPMGDTGMGWLNPRATVDNLPLPTANNFTAKSIKSVRQQERCKLWTQSPGCPPTTGVNPAGDAGDTVGSQGSSPQP